MSSQNPESNNQDLSIYHARKDNADITDKRIKIRNLEDFGFLVFIHVQGTSEVPCTCVNKFFYFQNRKMPSTNGSRARKASSGLPRRVELRLSQLKRNTARPKAKSPQASREMTEPQGENAAVLPMARPLKAFMAWVAGSS